MIMAELDPTQGDAARRRSRPRRINKADAAEARLRLQVVARTAVASAEAGEPDSSRSSARRRRRPALRSSGGGAASPCGACDAFTTRILPAVDFVHRRPAARARRAASPVHSTLPVSTSWARTLRVFAGVEEQSGRRRDDAAALRDDTGVGRALRGGPRLIAGRTCHLMVPVLRSYAVSVEYRRLDDRVAEAVSGVIAHGGRRHARRDRARPTMPPPPRAAAAARRERRPTQRPARRAVGRRDSAATAAASAGASRGNATIASTCQASLKSRNGGIACRPPRDHLAQRIGARGGSSHRRATAACPCLAGPARDSSGNARCRAPGPASRRQPAHSPRPGPPARPGSSRLSL